MNKSIEALLSNSVKATVHFESTRGSERSVTGTLKTRELDGTQYLRLTCGRMYELMGNDGTLCTWRVTKGRRQLVRVGYIHDITLG
jgi:hypothetical protein